MFLKSDLSKVMPFIWAFYHVPVQRNVHWRFQTELHLYGQIQYGRQTGSIPVTRNFFNRVHLKLIGKILALFRALYHIPGLRNVRWLLAQAAYGLIIQNGRQTGSIADTIFLFDRVHLCPNAEILALIWALYHIPGLRKARWLLAYAVYGLIIQNGCQTGSIAFTNFFSDRVHLRPNAKLLAPVWDLYHVPVLRKARWLLFPALLFFGGHLKTKWPTVTIACKNEIESHDTTSHQVSAW